MRAVSFCSFSSGQLVTLRRRARHIRIHIHSSRRSWLLMVGDQSINQPINQSMERVGRAICSIIVLLCIDSIAVFDLFAVRTVGLRPRWV